MTKDELERFRQQLMHLARRLQGDVSDLSNEAFRHAGGEASGNLSNVPMHPADLGSDNYEQEVALSLLETEGQRLEEISAAIQRLDAGKFGRCEECGKDIAIERLQALPFTRHCVECARKAQDASESGRRQKRL